MKDEIGRATKNVGEGCIHESWLLLRAARRPSVNLGDKKIYARAATVIGEMQACNEVWTSVYGSGVWVCIYTLKAYIGRDAQIGLNIAQAITLAILCFKAR